MNLVIRNKTAESSENRSFFSRLLSDGVYQNLLEMNNTKENIEKWAKKKIRTSAICFSIFVVLGFLMSLYLIPIGLVVSMLIYLDTIKSVKVVYQQFRFERQIQFSKFSRLLVPILKQTRGGINLRSVFERIVPRMPHEIDKKILQRLMLDVSRNPSSFDPFKMFAKQMSGTDSSRLFMVTLARLAQGSANLQVIDQLSRIASEEMMAGIEQIIHFKLSRFSGLYMKMVGAILVFVLGASIAIIPFQLGKVYVYL